MTSHENRDSKHTDSNGGERSTSAFQIRTEKSTRVSNYVSYSSGQRRPNTPNPSSTPTPVKKRAPSITEHGPFAALLQICLEEQQKEKEKEKEYNHSKLNIEKDHLTYEKGPSPIRRHPIPNQLYYTSNRDRLQPSQTPVSKYFPEDDRGTYSSTLNHPRTMRVHGTITQSQKHSNILYHRHIDGQAVSSNTCYDWLPYLNQPHLASRRFIAHTQVKGTFNMYQSRPGFNHPIMNKYSQMPPQPYYAQHSITNQQPLYPTTRDSYETRNKIITSGATSPSKHQAAKLNSNSIRLNNLSLVELYFEFESLKSSDTGFQKKYSHLISFVSNYNLYSQRKKKVHNHIYTDEDKRRMHGRCELRRRHVINHGLNSLADLLEADIRVRQNKKRIIMEAIRQMMIKVIIIENIKRNA